MSIGLAMAFFDVDNGKRVWKRQQRESGVRPPQSRDELQQKGEVGVVL
jgi:hypothetical protein